MNEIFEQIWENKIRFLITFFIVFTLSYVAFLAFDLLPEAPAEAETESVINEVGVVEAVVIEDIETEIVESNDYFDTEEAAAAEVGLYVDEVDIAVSDTAVLPLSISIKKINKTIAVLNPASRTIVDLDTALLDGVVRHPDSATLGQDGNVFILGHSSYLPTVFNKNFQAFNGIQNLEWGDIIEVSAMDAVYEYRVEKVYRAVAQDLTVPIAGTEKILTLATCNSFGSVDDRYIVEAKQVGVKKL